MDFRLTDEQEFIRDTIRKFIVRECTREAARAIDEEAAFPADLLRKLAATGFCGLNNPEAYGGGDRNLLGAAIVIEELAAVSPPLAGAFSRIALCGGKIISELGSDAQKQKWLPGIADGSLLFTSAMDDDSEEATAVREGGAFRLNGSKTHVPLGKHATHILTLAGTSLFVVEAASPGIQIEEIEQIGYRGASPCRVAFESVRVPVAHVLGEQPRYLQAVEQIEAAALGVGLAQGAYDYAANYARERVQFGQPIAQFEAIQHMLVEVAMELRSARWLLYHACWLADQQQPFALEAAMAKARAVELARTASLRGLHILGGYGFMMEYDAQRYVRDALALLSEPVETLKSEVGALLGLGARE